MNRFDFLEAMALYAHEYGDYEVVGRLDRLGFRLGCCSRIETADAEVKRIYGAIVRDRQWKLVASGRLIKRGLKWDLSLACEYCP
jgi:hypothetical protein